MYQKLLNKLQDIIRSDATLTDQQVMRIMGIASYIHNKIVISQLR